MTPIYLQSFCFWVIGYNFDLLLPLLIRLTHFPADVPVQILTFAVSLLFEISILLIIDRLAPFGFGTLSGDLLSDMLEPAVLCRPVPVLDVCRNIDHIPGMQLSRFFAPLLIPAASIDADQQLSAALVSVMNVPVVAAARLESHIEGRHLLQCQRFQIALSDEILLKAGVRLPDGKCKVRDCFFLTQISAIIGKVLHAFGQPQ